MSALFVFRGACRRNLRLSGYDIIRPISRKAIREDIIFIPKSSLQVCVASETWTGGDVATVSGIYTYFIPCVCVCVCLCQHHTAYDTPTEAITEFVDWSESTGLCHTWRTSIGFLESRAAGLGPEDAAGVSDEQLFRARKDYKYFEISMATPTELWRHFGISSQIFCC
jgi:hypothetical protein